MPDDRTQAPSPARPSPSRLAVLGTAVWLLAVVFTPIARIDTLIVLSPLVIHPLVLGLAETDRFAPRLSAAVAWVQLPAAVSLVAAFVLAPSTLALGLSIPWLALTAATALLGLLRIRDHGPRNPTQLCLSAGLCFVAIGGAWASSAALGFRPLGFSLTIVYLTAAHFHYAGFVLPVVAGLVVLELDSPLLRWVPLAVLAGVPLVAIGITGSPVAEVVGSIVLALGGAGVALGQIAVARRSRSTAAILLAVSGLALLWGMVLASLYAVTEFRGAAWPAIGEMIVLHGTVNALGFGLFATWGWTLRPRGHDE